MIAYRDTRGLIDEARPFTAALLEGIASGGGLFVPERLPQLPLETIVGLSRRPYHERAAAVYRAFEPDVPDDRIDAIAAAEST